jgi:hypothetical protein
MRWSLWLGCKKKTALERRWGSKETALWVAGHEHGLILHRGVAALPFKAKEASRNEFSLEP